MDAFLTLCLAFSSAMSLYHLRKSYVEHKAHVAMNEELRKMIAEVEAVKGEITMEHTRLKEIAVKLAANPDPAFVDDIGRKTWIN